MTTLILPKKDSFIKTYPKDANALSILLNYENTNDWLINCFIQITSYDNQYMDYYDFYYRNCPIIECQRIKIDLINKIHNNVISFIINSINNRYYPYLTINTKYIPAYKNQFDISHDLLVYGYDYNMQVFFISDNFSGKYSNKTCYFKELENAIINVPKDDYWFQGFRGCIELLSYNEEKRTNFETYRIKESISDYINSQPTKNWFLNHAMWNKDETRNRVFGISCYNTIDNHLFKAKQIGKFIEGANQAFYLMWEHKYTMLTRLDYLKTRGINIDNYCIEQYSNIEQLANICLMLKLKFDLIRDPEILANIKINYTNIKNNEEIVLRKLLKQFI